MLENTWLEDQGWELLFSRGKRSIRMITKWKKGGGEAKLNTQEAISVMI